MSAPPGLPPEAADARHHLLWRCLRQHLDRGAGDATALRAGGRRITYARLAEAVERGGRALDERFAPGARLVIAARNQLHVALALLAVLRSRCVPLLADPISAERVAEIIAAWRGAGGLGDPALFAIAGTEVVEGAAIEAWLDAPGLALEVPAVVPQAHAFWSFTSGTTGDPRAVVHAHRGPAAAFAGFAAQVLRLGPTDVTIATGGLPFVYVLGNGLFFPLMAGATAVLPADLLLPTVLGELATCGATVLVSGPWSLSAIVRHAQRPRWKTALRDLRLVLSAGEPLPPGLFEEWRRRFGNPPLDNLGCTEMFNSFLGNRPGAAMVGTLGDPVPGFELRVGAAAPAPGARGPLAVRGDSRAVAIGRPQDGAPLPVEGAWCETGDEVAVDGSGRFIFLGRSDDRFKVRGQFVHPAEIERRLGEVEGVAECRVEAGVDDGGVSIVVAQVVPAPGADADLLKRVRRHAKRRLQPFQVPARIDVVAGLARSARGKLERRRAPRS